MDKQAQVFDTDHLVKTYFSQALPLVLSMMVVLVYNLADTFFIAQTGDALLVAGVSLCAPVFTLLSAFGNIYGQGGSSLISRLLGSGDDDGVRRVSSFCFYVAIATGLVLALAMLLFRNPILQILGASSDTLPYASAYYTVLAIGAPAQILTMIHSNLLRCEGKAGLSMIGTSGGSILNIILDPIFISVLGWGAAGAAIATVIGYLASDVFFLIVVLRRSRSLSVDFRRKQVHGGELRSILSVGITAAVTNLATSVTVIVMNQFLLPYGDEKIAALGIVLKVTMVGQLAMVGFAFGGVPLFGYLYGAGNQKKLKELLRFCTLFLCGLALTMTAILFLAAPLLMGIFLQDASIISDGAVMLRWQVAGTAFAAIVLLYTCLFQATGKALSALTLSLSRQGVLFLLVLLVGVLVAGYNGFLAAQAVADLLSAVLALVLYRMTLAKPINSIGQ